MLSSYQLQLLYCFTKEKSKEIEKETGVKDHPDSIMVKDLSDELFRSFYGGYLVDYFKLITQMSNPDQKYYGVDIYPAAVNTKDPKVGLISEVYGVPACKSMIKINDHKRPVFQLGKAVATEELVKWISIDTSLFGDYYKGDKKEIFAFIQSHALKRLR